MIIKWIDYPYPYLILPMRSLLRQLTDQFGLVDNFSLETLHTMVLAEGAHIAGLFTDDGKMLIGMGTLTIRQNMLRKTAVIDDVVIDEPYHERGFGRQIAKALIDRAYERGVAYIDLTSRAHRVPALHMYRSLGFKKPNTNFLRLYLR